MTELAVMSVEQLVPAPTPAEVMSYLVSRGWVLHRQDDRWAALTYDEPGEESCAVEVPLRAEARDYPAALRSLLTDLALVERRPATTILRELRASGVDAVRLGLSGASTQDGTVPVEAGRRLFGAARDLLLAAACSAVDPRAVFANRKPDEALRFIEDARFGLPELGSYVIVLRAAVPPLLQPNLLSDEPDPSPPFARRAMQVLATGLAGARSAAVEASAGAGLMAFQSRASVGVSANLCDALSELLDAARADTLRAELSFASRRPTAPHIPRHVTFTADLSPMLREAARALRVSQPQRGAEVEGPVVKLNSLDPSQGGEVVLHAQLDGGPRF
ncbi:MAG: hypothetical protein RIT28_2985, partial [Pseudomonadota bacterium]